MYPDIFKNKLFRSLSFFSLLVIATFAAAFILGILWQNQRVLRQVGERALELCGINADEVKQKIDKNIIEHNAANPDPLDRAEITFDNLYADQEITLPMTVTGHVPGTWFFEASFPVTVTSPDGTVIATTHAQADAEWMTTNIIPFHVTIPATAAHGAATITFRADDPSDGESGKPIPEITIPVVIK